LAAPAWGTGDISSTVSGSPCRPGQQRRGSMAVGVMVPGTSSKGYRHTGAQSDRLGASIDGHRRAGEGGDYEEDQEIGCVPSSSSVIADLIFASRHCSTIAWCSFPAEGFSGCLFVKRTWRDGLHEVASRCWVCEMVPPSTFCCMLSLAYRSSSAKWQMGSWVLYIASGMRDPGSLSSPKSIFF
jgi:hypothetical protein